ncbi:heavy-metal-associated domain-containing protein [Plantibacter sp. VKM Ac-2880]|uniref:heavy-metal-associated domain-containing protein n=1 Tax=Plantibacter sp. VKM Ac-2880 TaxID=2783827 RepID=UPI00188DEBDC|nr:heavy-metal-associated domain-containing protein [Plantibacter sp. VKM Ac-2880]MBF4569633.1 heavy-metal-associated domain-containing protein [Plantibacter sp. VKM Ac-2880]
MSETTATTTYRVDGMTCAHCVSAVTTALSALSGVDEVVVDLDAGAVTVAGTSSSDEAAIGAGVQEAGYTLVGRR